MAWLDVAWTYRKSHTIVHATGAGTNYQMKVVVHYGAGTDSGADVYLNSHSRTDFGDVRFTDDDGTTLLDYWMESKVDSDNAVFWVEVADDLSTVAATIYVYYGNSTATTTSNFNNTFIDHDDFEDGTDGQAPVGWTIGDVNLTVSATSTYVNKGTKGLKCLSNGQTTGSYRSLTTITGNKNRAIEFWIKVVTELQNYYQYVQLLDGSTVKFYFSMRRPLYGVPLISYHDGTNWVSVMPYVVGTWYHIKIYNIDFTNRKFDMDVDGVNKVAGGTFYAAATQFTVFQKKSGDGTIWVEALDTLFVRKCVSPEPAHGSWGGETQINLTLAYNVDVVLKRITTKPYNIDIILKTLGVAKPYIVDTLLKKLGLTTSYDIDVALKKLALTKSHAIDVALKKLGLIESHDIDVILKKLSVIKSYDVDVILAQHDVSSSYGLDVILETSAIEGAKGKQAPYRTIVFPIRDELLLKAKIPLLLQHLEMAVIEIEVPMRFPKVEILGKIESDIFGKDSILLLTIQNPIIFRTSSDIAYVLSFLLVHKSESLADVKSKIKPSKLDRRKKRKRTLELLDED